MKGVVKSFKQPDPEDSPAWYHVEIEGEDKTFLLFTNWVADYGELKPGDRLEYEKRPLPVYSGTRDYNFFKIVAKA